MSEPAGPVARVLAGLGNPGERYEGTRHNVGFEVVDVLAARWNVDIRRKEFLALTAVAQPGRTMVLLMKPQTFMNASGRSAAEALPALGLEPGALVAIYDDLDLPLGRVRVRVGGGTGGHRGVASLAAELGDSSFARVRVGIGRPAAGRSVLDHVLSGFDPDEKERAGAAVALAADAVESLLEHGEQRTMERFNAL